MRAPRQALAIAALLATVAQSDALAKGSLFNAGHTDLGPTLGMGGLGSAGLSVGGRFEGAIKQLPSLGDGVLGIQVSADYYRHSEPFAAVDYSFS